MEGRGEGKIIWLAAAEHLSIVEKGGGVKEPAPCHPGPAVCVNMAGDGAGGPHDGQTPRQESRGCATAVGSGLNT